MNARRPIAVGEQYGHWTTIGSAPAATCYVACQCVCGERRYVLGRQLHQGTSRSCGCKGRRARPRPKTPPPPDPMWLAAVGAARQIVAERRARLAEAELNLAAIEQRKPDILGIHDDDHPQPRRLR